MYTLYSLSHHAAASQNCAPSHAALHIAMCWNLHKSCQCYSELYYPWEGYVFECGAVPPGPRWLYQTIYNTTGIHKESGRVSPMAELCKKLLYLRAQFNTADFAGATLGWIDRACHCFTGSYSTVELYSLPCVSLVNVTVLQNHTAWICHSSFHTRSITYQPMCTETPKWMSFSVTA